MRSALEAEIASTGLSEKVHILGAKPQNEVPFLMQQADIFILPSIYDGWGAVVNEALQAGCYVLVTDACGAADLIKQDERLGQVFHPKDYKALAACMDYANAHISEIRGSRQWRRQWAEEHISGKVVAKYMVDCICGANTPVGKAVWERD